MKNIKKLTVAIFSGLIAIIFEVFLNKPYWAFLLIATVASIIVVLMIIEMIKTLKAGNFGIDILAITAIIATLFLKEYWASVMILIMLTGGDTLEEIATTRAKKELKKLLDNSPQIANKIIDGKVNTVNINEILVGDTILVKPNEIIPVDGFIIKGASMIDESSLTGEALGIEKSINDKVLSGSVNGESSFTMISEKIAKESQYQTIVNLIKESEKQPAHFVRMADRYAVPFTIVAYVIAFSSWWFSKDAIRFAEVLVVASPCPLILAAPIAIISGMSRSSRNGIIIKTGTTLEILSKAKSIAFDKTGTITTGDLSVSEVIPMNHLKTNDLLEIAASLERESNHVLAKAIVKYAEKNHIAFNEPSEIKEIVGQGITGKINNVSFSVGKLSFVTSKNIALNTKKTAIFVSENDNLIGYITFSDTIRNESKKTVQDLRKLGFENILMISGDHRKIVEEVGKQVNIDILHSECLPQDKSNIISSFSKEQRPIIMVGDGVNDSPSLASADVGIAMGAKGATAASESADVVVLKDDLTKIKSIVIIAKDTMKIAKQSVMIGIIICTILMLIASTGLIPALIGAFLQELIDLISILSALRARKDLTQLKTDSKFS